MTAHALVPVESAVSGSYDAVIDTRSPAEFAEDHAPGAINCPVLSDAERAEVGTLYKQVSPFEARKRGAVLVARNIARHIEEQFAGHPKTWKPLVYCWRGGQRSGAMQIILRQIGWQADRLEGGYKAFRRHVLADTAQRAPQLHWRVLCAATGSAKTRILQAIAAQGGQVLDLETLAAHKGSVLGPLPGQDQPSQKAFETAIWHALAQFDPARPVYVEAESRKIGQLQVPQALMDAMRGGACIDLEASPSVRAEFLLRDYAYLMQDPANLLTKLQRLKERQGGETVAHWQALVQQEQWPMLVQALLEKHYDPLYRQSQHQNYQGTRLCPPMQVADLSPAGIEAVARSVLALEQSA
ncbi:MAG: tRNA 2-selenouridine(34) synthase MnmH [Brachymonas sp.]|nr:tRNA 2-selenouridine(34) synthase MnmH [Brachymonas sp.]